MAYGSELNQVWTNLIDNAADAMGDNGKLRIRTARENDFILVEIADNGPGIPPEVKPRIFEPFFTTQGRWRWHWFGPRFCLSHCDRPARPDFRGFRARGHALCREDPHPSPAIN